MSGQLQPSSFDLELFTRKSNKKLDVASRKKLPKKWLF